MTDRGAHEAVRVTVPASSANLGPGFDALGLALGLYDTVEVRIAGHGLRVEVTGAGSQQVPRDEGHLVVRALRAALAHLGMSPPGLALYCTNTIPHARGLGSSAAAIVAGIAAGYGLAGRSPDAQALQLAAGFEGHADNAAASLLGGLVIAWSQQGGYRAARLLPHPSLRPVMLIPEVESSTTVVRGLLPEQVPHVDAAFTAGRAALAVHALTTAPELLLAAMEDWLHQPYREPAWPESMRVVRELRAAGVPAAISGAGPAVLALTCGGPLPAGVVAEGFAVRPLAVDTSGVRVEPVG